jgi:hypothetical protein
VTHALISPLAHSDQPNDLNLELILHLDIRTGWTISIPVLAVFPCALQTAITIPPSPYHHGHIHHPLLPPPFDHRNSVPAVLAFRRISSSFVLPPHPHSRLIMPPPCPFSGSRVSFLAVLIQPGSNTPPSSYRLHPTTTATTTRCYPRHSTTVILFLPSSHFAASPALLCSRRIRTPGSSWHECNPPRHYTSDSQQLVTATCRPVLHLAGSVIFYSFVPMRSVIPFCVPIFTTTTQPQQPTTNAAHCRTDLAPTC